MHPAVSIYFLDDALYKRETHLGKDILQRLLITFNMAQLPDYYFGNQSTGYEPFDQRIFTAIQPFNPYTYQNSTPEVVEESILQNDINRVSTATEPSQQDSQVLSQVSIFP